MTTIPQNRRWTQNNRSDIFGTLWSSFNLDLTSSEGKLKASPRTIITTDDITDLGVPVAFKTFTDQNTGVQYAWTVAGGYVFRMNLINGYQTAFAKDTATGTPNNLADSDTSDMEINNDASGGFLVVTVPNDVFRFNPSTGQWNDGADELTSGGVHMLAFYAGRYYVTEDNIKIYSFTPANYNSLTTSSTNTLNLGNQGFPITSITFMLTVSDGLWVFTLNQSEKGCVIFKWDGVTADDPNSSYVLPDTSAILAGVIINDTPWVIDNNADLRVFNGGTFIKTRDLGLANGRLPVKNTKLLKNSLSAVNDRWIHPNGMVVVDGRIRILINNEYEDNGATIEENLPSGVWEYDPQVGWYHIMSLSNYVSSIKDYGQMRVSRVGALYAAKTETTDASANGTMLLGAQIFSDATTTKEIIAIDDSNNTVQKYASFVTQEIFTENIDEVWQEIVARFRKLLNSNNKIWVKYRTDKEDPVEATITWVDTNTCTTTTDVRDYVDYEMEVIQGDGSGKTSKIDSVSTGDTFTVELAETFTGATTNTAKARFQKWKELGSITEQDIQYKRFSIDEAAAIKIQIKVCLQFQGDDEFVDLILDSNKHQ